MTIRIILPSFAAGEVAPSLYGRVDLEKYAIGCKTLKNFFVHAHGGISNRTGSEYISTVKDSTKETSLIPFEFSTEQAYIIEAGNQYFRFYKDGEQLLYTAAGIAEFNPANSYLIGEHIKVGAYKKLDCGSSKYLYVAAPYGQTAATTVKVAVSINSTDNLSVTAASDTITISLANATSSKNTALLIQTAIRALTTVNSVSVVAWTVTENSAYAAARPTAAVTISASVLVALNKLYKNATDITESIYNTNYFPPDNASYWTEVTVNNPVEISTPYSSEDVFNLKFTQSADVMYITHPDYAPRELTRYTDIDWSLTAFDYKNGPFMDENLVTTKTLTPSAKTGSITITSNFNFFDSEQIGSIVKLKHDSEGKTLASSFSSSGTGQTLSGVFSTISYSGIIYCKGDWSLTLYSSEFGEVKLYRSLDGGNTWIDYHTYNANTTTTGTETTECFLKLRCTDLEYDESDPPEIVGISYSLSCEQEFEVPANELTPITWRLISHGTWAAKVHIEKSIDSGTTWTKLQSFSGVNDYNISTTGTETETCLLRLNVYSYSSGTLSYDFFVDAYMHTGIAKITAVTNARQATATILNDLSSATATDIWSEGSWSDYRGWPSCVTFYQDRLVFGATDSEPQKFWMSQTGDYTNFATNLPVEDTDAISRALLSRKVNRIYSMVGLSEIITLTSDANWLVGSGGSDVTLTPSTIKARCQGYKGASDVEPVIVDNRIIYIQSKGSVVRDLGYSLDSDSYVGDNLSIMSNHLVTDYNIVQMAYQQDPDSILWMIRDDGTLLGLTYIKEQQLIAWHRHETDGDYESICTIPGDGYDELWCVVKRGNSRFVERFTKRLESKDTEDQKFLDSHISSMLSPAANVITGLTHLEGKTVYVLADGFVFANLVVTSGQVALPNDYEATNVCVGLQYNCDFEPLNINLQLGNGTSQGKEKHICEFILRFENSLGGWIGPNSEHLDEVIQRTNESLGSPVDLQTGDYTHPVYGDWTASDTMFFRQIDPLPVTILAVIVKVEYGN